MTFGQGKSGFSPLADSSTPFLMDGLTNILVSVFYIVYIIYLYFTGDAEVSQSISILVHFT